MGLKFFIHKREWKKKGGKKLSTTPVIIPKLKFSSRLGHLSPRVGDLVLPPSVRLTVRTHRDARKQFSGSLYASSFQGQSPRKVHDATEPHVSDQRDESAYDYKASHHVSDTLCCPKESKDPSLDFLPTTDSLSTCHGINSLRQESSSSHTSTSWKNRSAQPTPRSLFHLSSKTYEDINQELLLVFMKRIKEASLNNNSSLLEVLTTDSSFTHSHSDILRKEEQEEEEEDDKHTRTSQMFNVDEDIATSSTLEKDNCSIQSSFVLEESDLKENEVTINFSPRKPKVPHTQHHPTVSSSEDTHILNDGFRNIMNDLLAGVASVVGEFLFQNNQRSFSSKNVLSSRKIATIKNTSASENKIQPVHRNDLLTTTLEPTHSKSPSHIINRNSNFPKQLQEAVQARPRLSVTLTEQVKQHNKVGDVKNKPELKSLSHCPLHNSNTSSDVSPKESYIRRSDYTAEAAIYEEMFTKDFWKEEEIKPVKKKMSTPSLWQKFWNTVDPYTLGELRRRHRNLVMREGCPVITRQKWNTRLNNVGRTLWRNAAYSHVELSIFSVENIPYISQVIVETGTLRYTMPFNCRFLRLPYYGEDQVIRLWFNSPVGKSQRNLFHPMIGVDEGVNHWTDYGEEEMGTHVSVKDSEEHQNMTDCLNNLDEDEVDETEMQRITDMKIHPQSQTFINAAPFEYTPSNDFRTYFRFDIPVGVLKRTEDQCLEGKALLDPQGEFYECNADDTVENNFHVLYDAGNHVSRQPLLKFCIKLNLQGIKTLVTAGDAGHDHLLRLPAYERSTDSLLKKLVYVSKIDDPIDQLVGELFNKNNQALLQQLGSNKLYRLCKQKYCIDNEEYDVEEMRISPTTFPDFDFTLYSGILSSSYSIGFRTPIVCTEDSYQPLLDFLLNSKKNQRWFSIEKIRRPFERYGVEISSRIFPMLNDWNQIEIPDELEDDPVNVQKLHKHAQAIRLNFALKHRIINEEFSVAVESLLEDLTPPLLQRGKGSHASLGRYTFSNLEGSCSPPVIISVPEHHYNKAKYMNSFLIPYTDVTVNFLTNIPNDSSPKTASCDVKISSGDEIKQSEGGIPIMGESSSLTQIPKYLAESSAFHSALTEDKHKESICATDNYSLNIVPADAIFPRLLSERNIITQTSAKLLSKKEKPDYYLTVSQTPWTVTDINCSSERNPFNGLSNPDTNFLEKTGPVITTSSIIHDNPNTSSEFMMKSHTSLQPKLHRCAGLTNHSTSHNCLPDLNVVPIQRKVAPSPVPLLSSKSTPKIMKSTIKKQSNSESHPSEAPNCISKFPLTPYSVPKRSEIYLDHDPNDISYASLVSTVSPTRRKKCTLPKSHQEILPQKPTTRDLLLEEQKINKIIHSRFTGKPLGYSISGVSALGEVIVPDEPPLPEMQILEKMTRDERLHVKGVRAGLLCQEMLHRHQTEWYSTKVYGSVSQALKAYKLDR